MSSSMGVATPTGDFPCRGCGQYHPSHTPCLGHFQFTPYDTNYAPPEVRWHNPTPIEQKLDKIIEQLEFICNELRRGSDA